MKILFPFLILFIFVLYSNGYGPVKVIDTNYVQPKISPPQGKRFRPVVLWHGMGDTCCYPFSMGKIKSLIESHLEGIFVYSLEIGETIEQDEFNSFLMNVNDQITYVCKNVLQVPELNGTFNAIGFSQGSQFLRAYVERCNTPAVHNLISVGGQHQGVFGFPRCPGSKSYLCDKVRDLLNYGAYANFVQDTVVQAEYWQDPHNYNEYLDKCIFLPDINNAKNNSKNSTYKANFASLNEFTMVKFLNDTMVQPKESEWFGFYTEGQDKLCIPYNETDLYKEDWIGLRTLDLQKKLSFLAVEGDHLEFTDEWFIKNIIPKLNNTIDI